MAFKYSLLCQCIFRLSVPGLYVHKKDSEWYCHRPQSQQNDSSTVLHCRIDQIPWNMQYLLVFSQSLCISERSPIRYCICKDNKYNMHAHCCQIQLNVNEYCQPNAVHVSDGVITHQWFNKRYAQEWLPSGAVLSLTSSHFMNLFPFTNDSGT